ncbi:hypothetical protein ACJ73_00928 [Blastomyces percursus]|uniref:Uncharacterized protein n=1 Tax=Blastomyces percursus TaxID=1658174 RepID=A0A1J9QHW8_9EURO|nr:hypothetical protein ACJ73_00928 [Blastomyces percursus]
MKNLLLTLPLLATVTSGRTLFTRDYLATREGESLNPFQGNGATEPPGVNGASFQSLGPTQQGACNAQFNNCVATASAAECQEQKAECTAAPDAAAPGQVQGQAQNQQADGQPIQQSQAAQDAQQDDRTQDVGAQTVGIAGATGVSTAQNAASTGSAVVAGADGSSAECVQAIAAARRRRDVVRRSF